MKQKNVSHLMSDFLLWRYNHNDRALQDYDFILSELDAAEQIFNLTAYQKIAIAFQYTSIKKNDNKKECVESVSILKTFIKKVRQEKISYAQDIDEHLVPYSYFSLKEKDFNKININRAAKLILEVSLNPKKLSSDAGAIWDLNHFYFSLSYDYFLDFIDLNFKDYEKDLSEEEFIQSKVSEFQQLLLEPSFFKSSSCIQMWDKLAKNNLMRFIKEYKTSDSFIYH